MPRVDALTETAAVLVGVATVIATVCAVVAVVRARRWGDWDRSAWFMLLVSVTMSLGPIFGTVTGERTVFDDSLGNSHEVYRGYAATVSRYSTVVLLAVSVAWIWSIRGGARNRPAPSGIAALILWGLGVASSFFQETPWFTPSIMAVGAVLLTATLLPPGRGAVVGAAVGGLVVALAGGFSVAMGVDGSVSPCRSDKCGPLGVLINGASGNENAYGLILAMTLPFVLLGFRGRVRAISTAYLVGMAFLTGGRSAGVAVVAVVFAVAFCRPRRAGTRILSTSVLAAGAAVGVLLPLYTSDASAFTTRGYAWAVVRDRFSNAPLLGHGIDAWSSLYDIGVINREATYSAHNLWMDALFVGGLSACVLTAVTLVMILRTNGLANALLPLTAVLYGGIFERPWTVTAANLLVWVLPAMILLPRSGADLVPGVVVEPERVGAVRGQRLVRTR